MTSGEGGNRTQGQGWAGGEVGETPVSSLGSPHGQARKLKGGRNRGKAKNAPSDVAAEAITGKPRGILKPSADEVLPAARRMDTSPPGGKGKSPNLYARAASETPARQTMKQVSFCAEESQVRLHASRPG